MDIEEMRPTGDQLNKMFELQHRMQSGIAALMNHARINCIRNEATEPKHLRVGVNTALCETNAMARLLMRKGIITNKEYYDAIIEVLEEEVDRYNNEVKSTIGPTVSI